MARESALFGQIPWKMEESKKLRWPAPTPGRPDTDPLARARWVPIRRPRPITTHVPPPQNPARQKPCTGHL